MKGFFEKSREPTFAAGGIVLRGTREPQVALVKLRKDNAWVLPKGKLKRKEDALTAARREVREETGHDVSVHEFLGSMSHEAGDNLKIVQFWRMSALGDQVRQPARDVKAVQWLPLEDAVRKLTHSREQSFLANVGPAALKAAANRVPGRPSAVADHMAPQAARHPLAERVREWFRRMIPDRPRRAG